MRALAAAARDASAHAASGERISPPGRYLANRVIGRGGVGVGFDGLDCETGQRIALMRIHSDIADVPEFVERFEREAEILRRLVHPNIVKLLALKVSRAQRQIVTGYAQ